MYKTTAISAQPGQTILLPVQTTDGYGARIDGYVPVVKDIYYPNGSLVSGYPVAMTRLETGLYVHGLILPTGASYLGTYIVSIFYDDPDLISGQNLVSWEIFIINVSRSFGNSSVSPG